MTLIVQSNILRRLTLLCEQEVRQMIPQPELNVLFGLDKSPLPRPFQEGYWILVWSLGLCVLAVRIGYVFHLSATLEK